MTNLTGVTNGTNAPPKASRRHWQILAIVCLVQFMLIVDDTVVNVALPSIQRELGFAPSALPWVVNAYVLAFGGLLVTASRVADRLGLVRTFVIGTALFALASLACGLAQAPWHLVAARFAQGIGAALTSPTVLGLIAVSFTAPKEHAKAVRLWGLIAICGGLSGVVLGGLITGLLSWRWIFFVNLPIAAIALLSLPVLARGIAPGQHKTRIEITGAVTITGAVAVTIYGLLDLADGYSGLRSAGFFALAALLFASFAIHERHGVSPLIPQVLLADRVRIMALVAGMLATGVLFIIFFTLTLELQNTLGLGPIKAGLGYIPFAVASLASICAAGMLGQRFVPTQLLVLGLFIIVVGTLLLTGGVGSGSYTALLPGLVVFGFGISLVLPVTAQLATSGMGPTHAGIAGGLVTSAQQLGGAVGLAFAGILLGAEGERHGLALIGGAVLAASAFGAALITLKRC